MELPRIGADQPVDNPPCDGVVSSLSLDDA